MPIRKITTANIGFCASWADGITMSICNSVQLLFQLDGILFGFCSYLHQQYFNQQRFQTDGILFPNLHKALSVSR